MAELLGASGISWKYYEGGADPESFGYWNPLPGFKTFMDSKELRSHLVDNTEYFRDLREGGLPAVAWIVPNFYRERASAGRHSARHVVCDFLCQCLDEKSILAEQQYL